MKQKFNALQNTKFASLAVILAASILQPGTASAAQVSGTATISLNGAWTAAMTTNGWTPTTFFDAAFNSTGINGTTTGGTAISGATSSPHLVLDINTNTTTIANAGGTIQATTMDTSNSTVGQIGLSGAIRLTRPAASTYLLAQDFQLRQVGGIWNLVDVSGFGEATFMQMVNVVDNLATTGTLDGDLQLLPFSANAVNFPWGSFIGATTTGKTTTFGHLSIAPAAVPLPASAWLFGGALVSLLGRFRRKHAIAV